MREVWHIQAEMAFWPTFRFAGCFGAILIVQKDGALHLIKAAIRDWISERQRDVFQLNHVYCN